MAARRRTAPARRVPRRSAGVGATGLHHGRAARTRPGDGQAASAADAVRPALLGRGVGALRQVLAFEAPADLVLRRFFRDNADLGRRDRGFVAETVFACLRRLRWLSQLADGRDPRRLFILAADRLPAPTWRELRPVLSEDEQAWLARCRDCADAAAPLGVRADLPDWVVEIMRERFSDDAILAIGRGMQTPAPLDLRVNTVRVDRAQVLTALNAGGIEARATRYSPLGIRLVSKPALERHPLYLQGAIEVQDEGSQLLGFLLAPRRREMVADLCAGAGGKTLLLGALMHSEGRLYAFDVSAHRIRRLNARLARSGLSNVQPEVIAHENDVRLKRLAGKLHRVLVDAPCTGFGTLRRNPDLKWRHGAGALTDLTVKQSLILEAASRLVGPGGRLVYATCSFLAAENEDIVAAFLRRHPEFAVLNAQEILARQGIAIDTGERLQLLPQQHSTDAFYAAVLERRSA
ncbi:MAG: RsmB/NOP family class I SAM-dependent RNA methyltransferase [Burkholderiales bacterium]|nr:RsmB/NOP family class I SAM-dependent RNA methyltransferase [Burkholderiales bacterium]